MRRSTRIILGLMVVLLVPNVVFSDCLTVVRSGPVNWYIEDERTIVFYGVWGIAPIAKVTLQTCRVNESSDIRLSKRYLCDSDKIIVDNRPCSIMAITSASGSS